jgi:DNA-binding protein HU-beta
MTKKEFVKMLAETMETSQKEADAAFTAVFGAVEDALMNGEVVSVPKFGKFFVGVQTARTCRNPQTGEDVDVPEKRVPKFKASSVLKENLL